MNLQQVAIKYGVNPNSLNAKDDGLKIGIKSVQNLVKEMEARKIDKDIIDSLKRLGNFMFDISDSTIG